jgi:sugar (pentulose or hexulose) kinase
MKEPSPCVLAIDNGTQSVRALIFDLDGQLLASSKVPLEAYFSRQPGWAEQEPEYYWASLCEACRALWEAGEIAPARIRAVALTTQRATVVNLDREGKPLRPAIVWLDQRRVEKLAPMGGAFEKLMRLAGQGATLDYVRSQAECNWIAQEQPGIWQATHKYLLLSGYHTYRLTGRFVDSVAAQVGYIPFDTRRFAWARDGDWRWRALPVRREQLPELVPPGRVLGHISEQAARATGIPAGLPLISAGADKACELLGSGCLGPGIGGLSYGTTATFNTNNTRYVEAIPLIPPYPAAIPGSFDTEIMVQRGYWMVDWFRREFGQREELAARSRGIAPEQLFDELLQQVPAGSMGLTLQPYWSPGLRRPGPEAKGAIIGFGDVHTRAHVYRAIIEGLAYALREGRERIERRNGLRIETLRVSGGGSQSDQAMQITADVFGMPAERPHTYETSGLGAAINAAVGVGLHPDHATAIRRMTHPGRVFRPDETNRRLYDRLYREVYSRMYARLGPLYRAIRRITGYPA